MTRTSLPLRAVTEEHFSQLLDSAASPDPGEVAAAGVATAALATLWPFTLAYLRGRISDEQLGAPLPGFWAIPASPWRCGNDQG